MTDFNLPPQKPDQALMMTICEGPDTIPDEVGHWFSPAKVAELLAAEREACAKEVIAAATAMFVCFDGRTNRYEVRTAAGDVLFSSLDRRGGDMFVAELKARLLSRNHT